MKVAGTPICPPVTVEVDGRDLGRLRQRMLELEDEIKAIKGVLDEHRLLLAKLESSVVRQGVE